MNHTWELSRPSIRLHPTESTLYSHTIFKIYAIIYGVYVKCTLLKLSIKRKCLFSSESSMRKKKKVSKYIAKRYLMVAYLYGELHSTVHTTRATKKLQKYKAMKKLSESWVKGHEKHRWVGSQMTCFDLLTHSLQNSMQLCWWNGVIKVT